MIEPHGISFEIATSIEGVREEPGSLLWLNLFRIYKESLTNAVKHARASAVKASLLAGPERLELAIDDNGRGLSGEQGRGRGISHMTARAQQLGGKLTVTSGSGTTVRLAIPCLYGTRCRSGVTARSSFTLLERGYTMDPVVHFEMPFEDRERMAKFYMSAFGWQTQMLGEEMGQLRPRDDRRDRGEGAEEARRDQRRVLPEETRLAGTVSIHRHRGGRYQKGDRKGRGGGRNVLGEPMDIPGVGSYVSFMDPEGNRVSMLQPIPLNWHGPKKKAKKKIAKKKAAKTKAGRKRKAGRKTAGKRS